MKFNNILEQLGETNKNKNKLEKIIKDKCKEYFNHNITKVKITRHNKGNMLNITFENFITLCYDSDKYYEQDEWIIVNENKFNNTLVRSHLIKIANLISDLDKIISGEVEI